MGGVFMDLHAHYLKNRTYRKYLPKEIEPEKLNAIMDNVVLAHCGNNRQLLRYAVVCSKTGRFKKKGSIFQYFLVTSSALYFGTVKL